MNLFFYQHLPSTSSEVIRLYEQACLEGGDLSEKSWGVVSESQSKGRGRQGPEGVRLWHSPVGHLYVSFLFPRVPWNLAPLQAAQLVARYLESYMGYAPLIKWPNDVLVDGKKMAGILTEGSDGENPYVCVGVGVNVVCDASLRQKLNVIALEEAMGVKLSSEVVRELAYGLADLFEKEFLPEKFQLSQLTAYMPALGTLMRARQPYLEDLPPFLMWAGCLASGEMKADPLDQNPASFQFSSAHPSYGLWGEEGPGSGELALLDVGNSSVKAYRIPPSVVSQSVWCDFKDLEVFRCKFEACITKSSFAYHEGSGGGSIFAKQAWLPQLKQWWYGAVPMDLSPGTRWPLYTISTHKAVEVEFRSFFTERFGGSWQRIAKRPWRLKLGSYPLEELGEDRLCLMEGVLATTYVAGSSQWCMVVSWGTAVTVDFITLGGDFLGGVIAPSPYLSLKALHQGTASLPDLSGFSADDLGLGQDTRSCMNLGAVGSTLSLLVYLFTAALRGRWFEAGDFSGVVYSSGGAEGRGGMVSALEKELKKNLQDRDVVVDHGEYLALGMLALLYAPSQKS